MFDERVAILENRKINPHYYKLAFSSKRLSRHVTAGQFFNLKLDDSTDPFLRRPFSYYRIRGTKVEILYAVLGRGTALLARKRPGDLVEVLGPLGRPFSKNIKGKKRVMVGGGVGVPPLVFLAETLKSERPLFLIGCKSKVEVLPRKEFSKVKAEIQYATDDGSYGTRGFVTVLLERILKTQNPKFLYIQTCGPMPMMSAVMKLAARYGVQGEASLEERMACGVGACLGCMAEAPEGFKTSCVEGPVFSFSDLAEFHGYK